MKIFCNGIQKIESNISKDEALSRTGAKIAFIITGFNSLSKNKQNELLKSPFPFAIELVPSEKETGMVDSLRKFNKEHVVNLNDDISGKKFLLSNSYSNEKLRAAVKNILSAYKYFSLYLIDTSSDLFTQSKYGLIEKELKLNSIHLEKHNSFVCLDDDNKESINSRLIQFVESAGGGRKNSSY